MSTAGAQAFLVDYTQGEWPITHHAGPVRVGANDCKCSRDQRLNVPFEAQRNFGIFGQASDDRPTFPIDRPQGHRVPLMYIL
jgi:hypothetical protein